MGNGQRMGYRLLTVGAILCTICGLVLATGAMAPLASESPASDALGDRFDDSNEDEASDQSATTDGEADPEASGSGGSIDDSSEDEASDQPAATDGDEADPGAGGSGWSIDDRGENDASDQPGAIGGSDAGPETGGFGGGSIDVPFGSSPSSDGPDDESLFSSMFGDLLSLAPGNGSEAAADGGDEEDGGDDLTHEEDDSDERTDHESDDREESEDDEAAASETDPDGGDSVVSDRTAVAALAAVALLAVGYVAYTRDDPIRTLLSLPGRLVSLVVGGVVVCSQALERMLDALRGVQSITDLPGLVVAAITSALRSGRNRVRSAREAATASLFGTDETEAAAGGPVTDEPTPRERIREAFESVVNASSMYRRRVPTATPTDVARSAMDAGAPRAPVETITDSFRDVEYGGRDPESRLDRTTTADERLHDALSSSAPDDEKSDDDTGPDTDSQTGTESKEDANDE